jgi:hypothetical protein
MVKQRGNRWLSHYLTKALPKNILASALVGADAVAKLEPRLELYPVLLQFYR